MLGALSVQDFLFKAKCPIPEKMLETTPPQTVARAKRGWAQLTEDMSLGAYARFLASCSFIQRTYLFEDVLEALSGYGLVHLEPEQPFLDFSTLTSETCKKSLPAMAKSKCLWMSWNVVVRKTKAVCYIPLTLDLAPHLIGKGGVAIKALEEELARTAKIAAPSVDSRILLGVESVEETIDVRRVEEDGKDLRVTWEKVLRKETRLHLRVKCGEVIVGATPVPKAAACVSDAATQCIRSHVRDLRGRLLKGKAPRKPRVTSGSSRGARDTIRELGDPWAAEYTDMKERNGRTINSLEKIRQWRSNKHYRRPPPCWCKYEWRGGRHKVADSYIDDLP
jgi:hypothetical protein